MSSCNTLSPFHFELTRDGSPTLRLDQNRERLSEAMHSSNGAFSESVYIYAQAMEMALRDLQVRHLGFASVGLGLGYNELIWACLMIRHERVGTLESFEIIPELREYFMAWVEGKPIPMEFQAAYNLILTRCCGRWELKGEAVRAWLEVQRATHQWQIREAFPPSELSRSYHCVLFDVFSAHTSPELWCTEVLQSLFSELCAHQCVFTTYAATGNLKRALRKAGFQIYKREGFAGKRESTLAVRK